MTQEQAQKLASNLRSPYFAGGGYLYDCPLCGSAQNFTAFVLVDGDDYHMRFGCFCQCDSEMAGEKLAQLSGLSRPVWLPQCKSVKRARVARKKKAPAA